MDPGTAFVAWEEVTGLPLCVVLCGKHAGQNCSADAHVDHFSGQWQVQDCAPPAEV